MPPLIRLLPETLANQIAAGEVVQRPASVVKELLENAIDAGSTAIKVIVKDAGKTLIQVIDNGIGMSEVDARMSFEKHATSKIRTVDDLFNIQTMGFRGEALASIAAVAQLEMETCCKKDTVGTRIILEGSQLKSQEPVAISKGTKMSVKNLFFNVPARRNFLKSNAVETKHIIDEFQRAALSQTDIAFSLYQNDLETYQLPPAKLSHRIVHLFGEAHKKQLIPCQEETDVLQIHGYIGKPEYAKRTRGEQFFFVNQRFVRSAYLHHAVKHTFNSLLPQNAFPFYVLFIDTAPAQIDVNVHPTKTEVKFSDERMVYSILGATIKKALATYHITPSINFEQNINFNPFSENTSTTVTTGSSIPEKDQDYAQCKRTTEFQQRDAQNWTQLVQSLAATSVDSGQPTNTLQITGIPRFPDASEELPLAQVTTSTIKTQLHRQYILTQIKSGILLIDQQAAHERILYERYLQSLSSNQTQGAQQLLFPVHIELSPADLAVVQAHTVEMNILGFVLTVSDKDGLIVTGCPSEAVKYDLKQLLEGLIEQLKWNQDKLTLPAQENLARSLAKRACIQPGKELQPEEIDALINQLFACTHPRYTPDGHKTFLTITLTHIHTFFQTTQ
mmetsp:Transcript_6117/g.13710  ORF Transcript_6117/g.13710 Transcript_6117/m.13710 type:complete len:618 (-) Transcript_6117:248-2101(-)